MNELVERVEAPLFNIYNYVRVEGCLLSSSLTVYCNTLIHCIEMNIHFNISSFVDGYVGDRLDYVVHSAVVIGSGASR